MQSSKKRGPKPKDAPLDVQTALLRYKECIVANNKVVPKSDPIWGRIKEENNFTSSPEALYTFTVCNRGPDKILYELGVRQRLPPVLEEDESENSCADTESQDSIAGFAMTRKIFIPPEKWQVMKPTDVTYKRNDPTRHTKERTYLKLQPGVWGNILNLQIHQETRLPCSWSFKNHEVAVSDSAQFFLRFEATCPCGGTLEAFCENPPPQEPEKNGVYLEVVIKNVQKESHDSITKRPIKGNEREELGKRMLKEGLTASRVRKDKAGEVMEMFELEPSVVPRLETLRKIKSSSLSRQKLSVESPIQSIELLKYSEKYQLSIFDLGSDPFFVHYFLPDQIRLFNAYVDKVYSRIIVDATGKISDKIERPVGMSGHIFLYEAVISIPGEHEGQVPVAQMLSERHHTEAIVFWLKMWCRSGAKNPNEIVVDFSSALISALCQAFARVSGTKAYLEMSFLFLTNDTNHLPPSVLIRVDVAHLVKMIVQWKSIKAMRKRCKEFYVRGIYLIILAKTFAEAEALIKAIFIVASNETEGKSISTGEDTPCEEQKKFILELIGRERVSLDYVDKFLVDSGEESTDDCDDFGNVDTDSSRLKAWLNQLFNDCIGGENIVEDGDRDNIMYNIEFRNAFLDLCYKLPLWSNILARAMNSPYENAVGAHVESYFNDLKTRLIRKRQRVDLFLQEHLNILQSTMKLASGLKFFHQKETCVLCLCKIFPNPLIASKCKICSKRVHNHTSCSILQPDGSRVCIQCTTDAVNPGEESGGDVCANFSDAQSDIVSLVTSQGRNSDSDDDASKIISLNSSQQDWDHVNDFMENSPEQSLCDGDFEELRNTSFDKQSENETYLQSIGRSSPILGSKNASNARKKRFKVQRKAIELQGAKINCPPNNCEEMIEVETLPESETVTQNAVYKCVACANGNFPDPDGAHKCAKCQKAVHALPGCSAPAPGSTEGYGQSRICFACSEENNRASASASLGQVRSPVLVKRALPSRGKIKSRTQLPPGEVKGPQKSKDLTSTNFGPKCCLCSNGSLPSLDIRCVECKQGVHELEGCSILMPGCDGVHRSERICITCAGSLPSKGVLGHFENWRGLATLPPKKRGESYYGKAYPELKLRIDNNFDSKLKPLKNGGLAQLKPKKFGKIKISLNNTCSVDALIHLLATAYCDSPVYRTWADSSESELVKLAVHIASKGVQAAAYQMRAEMLYTALDADRKEIGFGLVAVDCARSATSLATSLNLPPSMIDIIECSSPFCPSHETARNLPVLTAKPEILLRMGICDLQAAIEDNFISPETSCLHAFPPEIPHDIPLNSGLITNYPPDPSYSKFALCGGNLSHKLMPQSAILISVMGSQETTINPQDVSSVEAPLTCKLDDVPTHLLLGDKKYTLRGLVSFNQPTLKSAKSFKSAGIGHYMTYARRIGGKWEVYDDMKEKQLPVKGQTEANVELVLYTVTDL